MKPRPLITPKDGRGDLFGPAPRKRRGAPVTDFNFHSGAFGGSSGRFVHYPAQSFWSITRDYLKDEARQDFWSEAALFAFITVTAALPLINNVQVLIEFVRAISSH
jgi:hypothetical protein